MIQHDDLGETEFSCRIIASAACDLESAVEDKRFRGDLYRLIDPAAGQWAAWMQVAGDRGQALVVRDFQEFVKRGNVHFGTLLGRASFVSAFPCFPAGHRVGRNRLKPDPYLRLPPVKLHPA